MVDVIDKERQELDPTLRKLLEDAPSSGPERDPCVQCRHVLARAQDATTVQGSHHHFCTNPHGIDFNVCCYSQALGCAISCQPTGADSWFAGYTWRFATCSECNVHLGWLFETADSHFYGLVRERIQLDEE